MRMKNSKKPNYIAARTRLKPYAPLAIDQTPLPPKSRQVYRTAANDGGVFIVSTRPQTGSGKQDPVEMHHVSKTGTVTSYGSHVSLKGAKQWGQANKVTPIEFTMTSVGPSRNFVEKGTVSSSGEIKKEKGFFEDRKRKSRFN